MKKDSPTSRPYDSDNDLHLNIYIYTCVCVCVCVCGCIYALSVFQKSEAWREEKYPNHKKLLPLSIMAAYIQVS